MKANAVPQKPLAAAPTPRTPRVAAVRRIAPERVAPDGPRRVWSLLLPPRLERDQ